MQNDPQAEKLLDEPSLIEALLNEEKNAKAPEGLLDKIMSRIDSTEK